MTRTSFPLFGIALLISAFAGTGTSGAVKAQASDTEPQQHAAHSGSDQSTLVEQVREATEPFRETIPADYQQFLGCVSGPEQGAMGIHFVNFALVDGKPEVRAPEALIYEVKN